MQGFFFRSLREWVVNYLDVRKEDIPERPPLHSCGGGHFREVVALHLPRASCPLTCGEVHHNPPWRAQDAKGTQLLSTL